MTTTLNKCFFTFIIFSCNILQVAAKETLVQDTNHNVIKETTDTIHIPPNRHSIILVESKAADYARLISTDIQREQQAIRSYYDSDRLHIIPIMENAIINFDNTYFIDISDQNENYEMAVYWDGTKENAPIIHPHLSYTTEFLNTKLDHKYISPYLTRRDSVLALMAAAKSQPNFTTSTSQVLQAMLQQYCTPSVIQLLDDFTFFTQELNGITSIQVFMTNPQYQHVLLESFTFKQGKLATVTYYDLDNNTPEYYANIIYKDDRIDFIDQRSNSTNFYYADQYVITTRNAGDGEDIKSYWLEDGILLANSYTLFTDPQQAYMDMYTTKEYHQPCVYTYISGELWTITCVDNKDSNPYNYTYTSFQHGDTLQQRSIQIRQTDKNSYTANHTNEKDAPTHYMIYHTNIKGLVNSIEIPHRKQRFVIMYGYE